jgi:hypothetical protein
LIVSNESRLLFCAHQHVEPPPCTSAAIRAADRWREDYAIAGVAGLICITAVLAQCLAASALEREAGGVMNTK